MIRITVEIDGVEMATTTLGKKLIPAATFERVETALPGYLAEGNATAAGAAPVALTATPPAEAAMLSEASDAGAPAIENEDIEENSSGLYRRNG